jgi:hypothetical protein
MVSKEKLKQAKQNLSSAVKEYDESKPLTFSYT